MTDEEVTQIDIIIIQILRALEFLVYKRSCKGKILKEHTFKVGRNTVEEIIVTDGAELAAVVVHRITGHVAYAEIQILAYVAVKPSGKLEPVAVDRYVITVYKAR